MAMVERRAFCSLTTSVLSVTTDPHVHDQKKGDQAMYKGNKNPVAEKGVQIDMRDTVIVFQKSIHSQHYFSLNSLICPIKSPILSKGPPGNCVSLREFTFRLEYGFDKNDLKILGIQRREK